MYYKLTPVTTPPKEDGWYFVHCEFHAPPYHMHEKYTNTSRYKDGQWTGGGAGVITHYLAPVEEPGGIWIELDKDGRNQPEEIEVCLWCKVPIVEPPYVGSSAQSEIDPGYFTHFMRMKNEFFPDERNESHPAPLCVTVEQLRAMWEAAIAWEHDDAHGVGKFENFDDYLKQHFGI